MPAEAGIHSSSVVGSTYGGGLGDLSEDGSYSDTAATDQSDLGNGLTSTDGNGLGNGLTSTDGNGLGNGLSSTDGNGLSSADSGNGL